jgi:hypothetical protein
MSADTEVGSAAGRGDGDRLTGFAAIPVAEDRAAGGTSRPDRFTNRSISGETEEGSEGGEGDRPTGFAGELRAETVVAVGGTSGGGAAG